MTEDKYYIPNIEEFHVGFEYEILEEDGWINSVVASYKNIRRVEVLLQHSNNSFRVKYLDKADIEELGFEFSKADEKTYLLYYIKGRIILAFMDVPTTEWIEIYNAKSYDPSGPRIFKGCVKNKSELKQVLKMLGIYED